MQTFKNEMFVFLILLVLSSCCEKCKETDGKNTLFHRLELIKKPVCELETYEDVVKCLLMYNEALKQSNRDKEEIVINY